MTTPFESTNIEYQAKLEADLKEYWNILSRDRKAEVVKQAKIDAKERFYPFAEFDLSIHICKLDILYEMKYKNK